VIISTRIEIDPIDMAMFLLLGLGYCVRSIPSYASNALLIPDGDTDALARI
jgi:hypothetical protein